MKIDDVYKDILIKVLSEGKEREDRTEDGTISIFSHTLTLDNIEDNFPILTTKKVAWKSMVGELLWFINGENTIPQLKYRTFGDKDIDKWTIWTPNYEKQGKELGYTDGYCGPIYGVQWRDFQGPKKNDQLKSLVDGLRRTPYSRRHLVTAWNPTEIDLMILPPCHWAFECYVDGDTLNLKWHERSVDFFLGLPFNIASYALLLKILAKLTGYKAGTLIGDLTNVHIYKSHIDAVKEQLERSSIECKPIVDFPDYKELEDLSESTADDFKLINYKSHPPIKAEMLA